MKGVSSKVIVLSVLLMSWIGVSAQNGTIKGVITDGRDSLNKPIIGAQIFISGTTYGGFTGIDGSYTLSNVAPGKYDLTISYVLIGNETLEGVKVEPGETVTADFAMGNTAKVETQAVVTLVLTKDKESEEAATGEMKNTEEVVEVESGAAMRKKGATTVGSAAARISGVSIVDGKYAYIRGLSDRYSRTLLNNADIPGLDPDRVAVQLDLFPAAFVQSMGVVKSYSPDLPGDFTGGLIDIRTREAYDSMTVNVNFGTSYNPQVHFNDQYLTHEGSATDFLGFDNGSRQFSDEVNEYLDQGEVTFPDVASISYKSDGNSSYSEFEEDIADWENVHGSLNNNLSPERKSVPLNHNLGVSLGNTLTLKGKDSLAFKKKVGYFAGINYRRSFSYYDQGVSNRYEMETGIEDDSLLPVRNITTESSKDEVLVGALGSIFYRYNPNSKIKLDYIHNHTGTKSTSRGAGFDRNATNSFEVNTLNYVQRSMNTFQLSGDHLTDTSFFNKKNWILSYTRSSQEQPDFRVTQVDNQYDDNGDIVNSIIRGNFSRPTRFNREMKQNTIDAKVNLTKDILRTKKDSTTSKISLKTGADFVYKNRTFNEAQIRYGGSQIVPNGDFNEFASFENIELDSIVAIPIRDGLGGWDTTYRPVSSVELLNTFSLTNQYTASQVNGSGYLMGTLPLGKKTKLTTGARAEYNSVYVESEDPNTLAGELQNFDILPVVNLSYQFFENRLDTASWDSTKFRKQDLKLQFIYSRTLSKPTFREVAPFFAENFILGVAFFGNPDIERGIVDNFDLRLEFYPNSGEIISASLFYKNFNSPIVRTTAQGVNGQYTWVNAESAFLYGIELEFKRKLDFVSSRLHNWNIGFNGSLLKSQMTIPEGEYGDILAQDSTAVETRPLNGQSPYLLNCFLQYDNKDNGWNSILTYNLFGERLSFISEGGLPSIYERGRGELNFSISKKLGKASKITLRARNLLNPSYEYYYKFTSSDAVEEKFTDKNDGEDFIFSSYKKGRKFSISYSYTF